jgi:hypothetical protein
MNSPPAAIPARWWQRYQIPNDDLNTTTLHKI